MKLKEFNFKELQMHIPFRGGLSIFDGDKEVAMGFIGKVLKNPLVEALADREIKETNWFFDIFVIRL